MYRQYQQPGINYVRSVRLTTVGYAHSFGKFSPKLIKLRFATTEREKIVNTKYTKNMVVAALNTKDFREQLLLRDPRSLETAIGRGPLPCTVPSVSLSFMAGALRHMDPRVAIANFLELEANRTALLASRASQPSLWLNKILAASRPPAQVSFADLAASTGLDLLTSAASLPPRIVGRRKNVDAEASPICKFLATSSGKCELSEVDVLCGRGGRSNHHPGNKRYRQVISEMKASYRNIGSKSAKTDLSRAIVDHVFKYGGRFMKIEKGDLFVLTPAEARKKTSQALREAKDIKWTK